MKRLLLAGLVSFGGAAAVLAQTVTSINAVGYVNLTIPNGFSMIANQLNGASGNTLGQILPAPPTGTQIYKWNGAGFTIYSYAEDPFTHAVAWSPNANGVLGPGEGAFIYNPGSSFTMTLVGEVPTGTGSNVTLPSGYALVSSAVPQSGPLASSLSFPVSVGDQVYIFTGSGYTIYSYAEDPFTHAVAWTPSEPSVAVGQSFWSFKGAGTTWNRNFSL